MSAKERLKEPPSPPLDLLASSPAKHECENLQDFPKIFNFSDRKKCGDDLTIEFVRHICGIAMRKEANYGSVGSTAGVNNTNPEAVRTSLDRGQGLGWLRRSQQGCTETTPRERSELLSPAAGLVHSVCGATIYEIEFPLAKV